MRQHSQRHLSGNRGAGQCHRPPLPPRINTEPHAGSKCSDKEKILKAARQKNSLTYKERPIKLAVYLSTETWQARRKWHDIFNMLNRKYLLQRIPYPQKLLVRVEGEKKSFPDKTKEGCDH